MIAKHGESALEIVHKKQSLLIKSRQQTELLIILNFYSRIETHCRKQSQARTATSIDYRRVRKTGWALAVSLIT
jgi:hypothetical protein